MIQARLFADPVWGLDLIWLPLYFASVHGLNTKRTVWLRQRPIRPSTPSTPREAVLVPAAAPFGFQDLDQQPSRSDRRRDS